MTTRWRCVCAYDGTDLAGWQKQPAGDAVQDKIEKGLEEILRRPVRTIGAGRTDAGVMPKAKSFISMQARIMTRRICSMP